MFRTMIPGLWLLGLSGLLAGCFGDGKQTTIKPASNIGHFIQDVYAMVTWIDLGILILVFGLFFWAVFKYRATKENENEVPEQVHGSAALELAWTIIPAVILIFIAVPTWQGIFKASKPEGENPVKVEAIGHQWWWEFRYNDENTVTANELVIPVNRTVIVNTKSVDVIHSFWIPRLSAKIDSMPDRTNLLWFIPEEEGLYYGQCVEYCGTSHANMRFRVRVVSEDEFEAWLARQNQPPAPATDDAKAGEQLFVTKTCIACHTIKGNPMAAGIAGPNLNNLKERSALASALIDNTPENLERWIRDPQAVKPGAKMGVLDAETGKYKPFDMTEQEAKQLVAYLFSEPGEAAMSEAPASDQGTAAMSSSGGGDAAAIIAAKGCGACHKIPGIPNAVGAVGPTLEGLSSRDKIAAGLLDNTPENMKKWLENPRAVKPNTLMVTPPLSESEIDTLVQFLGTL